MTTTNDKFYKIYEDYKNLVLKLAYDMTNDYHYSQDICQETFMRLFGFQDNVDESRLKSWLMVVAANLVRDYWRRGGKYTEILGEPKEMLEGTSAVYEDNVEAYLDELGLKELRSKALNGLRDKNQAWYEVFIMVEYLDIPRKVIAKKRKIALSTVDSYLKKGKEWMRKEYGDEYQKS